MRVLLRSMGKNVDIINGETGEHLDGVSSASFFIDEHHKSLTLRLHDFDVEIEEEATILSGKNLVERKLQTGPPKQVLEDLAAALSTWEDDGGK